MAGLEGSRAASDSSTCLSSTDQLGPVDATAPLAYVQLSAISGLLWEGEVPGDCSCIFGFVLREAVVALQQHPGVLTLLIDTMVLSPSNALELFTPGHSYDVMVVVAESPKLLQTWFAKWRHHTDFVPALVDSSDEKISSLDLSTQIQIAMTMQRWPCGSVKSVA